MTSPASLRTHRTRKLVELGIWPERAPFGSLVVQELAYAREFWRTGYKGVRVIAGLLAGIGFAGRLAVLIYSCRD